MLTFILVLVGLFIVINLVVAYSCVALSGLISREEEAREAAQAAAGDKED